VVSDDTALRWQTIMAVTPRLPAETGRANRPSLGTLSPRSRLRCGARGLSSVRAHCRILLDGVV